MEKSIEEAVERAIATMHSKLGETVTIDDMARAAMFSKFHFTRVFNKATGLSPGRFLSAIRLQRAKSLLVSTPLSVADISFLVGYNSVGTFSSRFSRSVGLSPTAYRRLGGFAPQIPAHAGHGAPATGARIHGVITPHDDEQVGLVFTGLFPTQLPEGAPVRCTILEQPGAYDFANVPPGTWYLLAHCIKADRNDLAQHTLPGNIPVSVGTRGPITVGHSMTDNEVNLTLQPMRSLDPPVLLALLDARRLALGRAERREEAARLGADRPAPFPDFGAAADRLVPELAGDHAA